MIIYISKIVLGYVIQSEVVNFLCYMLIWNQLKSMSGRVLLGKLYFNTQLLNYQLCYMNL